ncbi:hypothetical protein ACFXHA_23260 [Nocardia sp. NPDC059240]|uniref:hypothetical protein n=1 Tax=Nocardia sp. NPDC059240 TaxID=3346786 RepID=UPI0036A8E8F0
MSRNPIRITALAVSAAAVALPVTGTATAATTDPSGGVGNPYGHYTEIDFTFVNKTGSAATVTHDFPHGYVNSASGSIAPNGTGTAEALDGFWSSNGIEGTFHFQLANGHQVQVYVREEEQDGSPAPLVVNSDDPNLRYQVLGWRGHRAEEEPTVNDHQWPRITFWDGDYANSAAAPTTTP